MTLKQAVRQTPRALTEAYRLAKLAPMMEARLFAMAGHASGGDRRGANAVLDDIQSAVEDMKEKQDGRLRDVESHMTDLTTRLEALRAGNVGDGDRAAADDPVYSKSFNGFLRSGEDESSLRAANRAGRRAEINASMSVGSPGDGGYLAPTEWDRKINKAQLAQSPMRRLADVVTTGVNAYSTLWDSQGWGSGWVGETAVRPPTSSTTLAPLTFPSGEIYAMPSSTQRLLDDADYDIESYLTNEVQSEFARQENVAFISGNGTNKPNGLLTYAVGGANAATHPGGALDTITVAGAAAATIDELIDFSYGLASPYRQNASWLVASTSVAKLMKLKDGQGNYLWRESVVVGQPATLMGRPVEVDENMPAMTTGNLAIAYGDFKAGYLINDRKGIRVLRDPYTNKPYIYFYMTKRVGGGVRDPRAIRLIKMA